MKIGILSDTHDQVERTAVAVALLVAEGAQALVHCGDLTGVEIVEECARLPCYYVLGNNDFDEAELESAIRATGGTFLARGGAIELHGRRLAVTHGDSAREVRRLAAGSPDYFLFGHSHATTDNRDGPTRYINPGALHRASRRTVAVLDLADDGLRFLDVLDHHRPRIRGL